MHLLAQTAHLKRCFFKSAFDPAKRDLADLIFFLQEKKFLDSLAAEKERFPLGW